jgi:hypothetical protein
MGYPQKKVHGENNRRDSVNVNEMAGGSHNADEHLMRRTIATNLHLLMCLAKALGEAVHPIKSHAQPISA